MSGASKRFEQKLAAALELLSTTGMWRITYAPPLFRLLWNLGVEVPPPHFCRLSALAIFFVPFFGITWGTAMWFAAWSRRGMALEKAATLALLAGLLLGLGMAAGTRRAAKKHGIPLWRDFRPTDVDAFT